MSVCKRFISNGSFVLAVLISLHAPGVRAITLYSTDFEEFTAGADRWAGTNSWQGSSAGVGVHGIDQDMLPGLGKTAYLGSKRPKSTFVTVFRPVQYDPVSNGTPIVQFETLMGIQDSTNGFRDSFFFTFYNGSGSMLGSLRFDNSELNYGIWRLDGTNQYDTGADFIRSQLHLVLAKINFASNRWDASLDGVPLFTNATFNGNARTLNLGYVAAEWQLSSTTNNYGDNWMLLADWAVRTYPVDTTPYALAAPYVSSNGSPGISWTGARGYDYALDVSRDMVSWQSTPTNGVFTNILVNTPLSYVDTSTTNAHGYYRIRRNVSP